MFRWGADNTTPVWPVNSTWEGGDELRIMELMYPHQGPQKGWPCWRQRMHAPAAGKSAERDGRPSHLTHSADDFVTLWAQLRAVSVLVRKCAFYEFYKVSRKFTNFKSGNEFYFFHFLSFIFAYCIEFLRLLQLVNVMSNQNDCLFKLHELFNWTFSRPTRPRYDSLLQVPQCNAA